MNNLIKDNKTAFYVFDVKKAKERIKYLKEKLPENVSICYAVKANTFIIKELIGTADRFEVCSPGEARICDKLGVPENQTVISGVYKTPSVIEEMVSSSFDRIYTAESVSQFNLLCELSEKYERTLPVLLRLTNGSQFGMNGEDIRQIISQRQSFKNLDISGIQFFSGTQKTSVKKIRREIKKLDEFLLKLDEDFGYKAQELEYGPGFPAAYFTDDSISEEELFSGFSEELSEMVSRPEITLELGRSIAACCGKYYTHIVDIKRNKGQNYVLIDGGMHHLVYFGQHMAMRHPFLSICGKEDLPDTDVWNICGSLCSMNDIAAKQVPLPELQIGDTLCFENTGAYCMTEGISLFLSRELPEVYLKKENGEMICVRSSFETSDLNTPNY